jgi:hypothetical protein
MANIEKRYLPMAAGRDLSTLAELWDEPVGLDPVPVEAARLVLKMKKTMLVLEQLAIELNQLEAEDNHGRLQARPIMEMWERSQERFADIMKFALKYDLSERRLQLQEQQAKDVGTAILRVVMDPTLQLTDDQLDKIRMNLASEMALLSDTLKPDWMKDEFDVVDVDVDDD